ncbi:MAG: LacI family DNA-binding transcriptional regulator [Candidatus Marinimicrobia bacterium]|jgi:LacI family transcriptional regulator|nr:LacI family DNA-binding transcriptional regulator [Candidatus Neomarinimicrobiota bacterium]MBT3635100.1 LacI family DNA-binding transcriptional regulator [Candidatus Neomarinimicrobiota bacterium]MBT3683168.1 LacI family DNA-binding transcriptional regulator [Candidatus Neomarinimicrobiota bacterium]MBT3759784.1 LacI family DNA-binding transcriptional regulator [Candidatus Neomarinimicrobiota bacterium]MBT3895810.1 LacI family DNA-binding transcriptional regulator [Candidatus Neomarinimicro
MTNINKTPTLKIIAEIIGCSASTVSRALQDHPGISQDTKKRICEMAKKMDYSPDSVARSLQKKSTTTIGVIVPEIRHDFFSSAIDGIEDRAYQAGYTIIVSKSNEDYNREVLNTRSLTSNRVAGIIASVAQTTRDGQHFLAIRKRGIPVVLFDRVLEDVDVSKVIVDDYVGAYNSVKHLIDCGCIRIGHLSGPKHLKISNARLRGYKAALENAGIGYDDNLVVTVELDEKHGMEGVRQLLNLENKPDAIFAINDPVAVGAHKEIQSQGYIIPDDISITGFSNNPITEMIEPQLTTVDQHGYKMGQMAAELILDEINSDQVDWAPETRIVETELIIRGSTVKN